MYNCRRKDGVGYYLPSRPAFSVSIRSDGKNNRYLFPITPFFYIFAGNFGK